MLIAKICRKWERRHTKMRNIGVKKKWSAAQMTIVGWLNKTKPITFIAAKFPILNPIDCACAANLLPFPFAAIALWWKRKRKKNRWLVCLCTLLKCSTRNGDASRHGRWWWWHENDGCCANSSHLLNFNSTNAHHSYVLSNRFRSLCWFFPAPFSSLARRSSNACNKMIWKYVDFLLLVDVTVFDWFVSKFLRFSFIRSTLSFVTPNRSRQWFLCASITISARWNWDIFFSIRLCYRSCVVFVEKE